MECMRKYCGHSQQDTEVNDDSDSSLGLYATDTEQQQQRVAANNANRDQTETSSLAIVDDSKASSISKDDMDTDTAAEKKQKQDKKRRQHRRCAQCKLYETKMNEQRTMVMAYRKEQTANVQKLKQQYNKLLNRYKARKTEMQTLIETQQKNEQHIQNMQQEMQRLSDDNLKILSEKHSVDGKVEELQSEKCNLQLQINAHAQQMHELQATNDTLQTELSSMKEKKQQGTGHATSAAGRERKFRLDRIRSQSAPYGKNDDADSLFENGTDFLHDPGDSNMDTMQTSRSLRSVATPKVLDAIDEQKEHVTRSMFDFVDEDEKRNDTQLQDPKVKRYTDLMDDDDDDHKQQQSVEYDYGGGGDVHNNGDGQQVMMRRKSSDSLSISYSFSQTQPLFVNYASNQKHMAMETPISPFSTHGSDDHEALLEMAVKNISLNDKQFSIASQD